MGGSQSSEASSGSEFLEKFIVPLTLLDLWPRRVFQNSLLNFIWIWIVRITAYAFFTVTFLCFVNCFFTLDDLNLFTESVLYLILGGTVSFEWFLFKIKRKQVEKLFELFKSTYRQGKKIVSKANFESVWKFHYKKVGQFQWIWSFVFYGMYLHWIVFYVFIPLVILPALSNANATDKDEIYRFSFQAWYPYNKYVSPYYDITVSFEAYLLIFMLYVMYTVDFFCNSFMIYLLAHMQNLIDALMSLPADNGANWPNNQQRFEQKLFEAAFPSGNWKPYLEQNQHESKLDNHQKLSMIECIRHHKLLVELFEHFCKEMTNAMLCNAIKSLGCICLFAFQSMMLPEGETKQYNMLEIAMFYVLEFFVYAWYADKVSFKSQEMKWAIYQSAWVEAPKKFKIICLITMIRNNRIMIIPCGPFAKMNLALAIELSKFSFSVYTCLSQMEARGKIK